MENPKIRNGNIYSFGDRDRRDGYGLSWLSPTSSLTLSNNDVHVWLTELDPLAECVQQMVQCLSENELVRAGRFHFKRDKKRFILCRAALRTILGSYLNIEPNRVQFSYGPHGKPYLAKKLGNDTLQFNLARSHKLALYAFASNRQIGVDLEYLRALPDAEQIAARFFSAHENASLQALSASQRRQAFFNCWTRKEAYIKAIGKGLSQPLDQFEVSLAPSDPVNLLHVEGDPKEVSRWSLNALTPAPGYVAALAVEGHNWRPTFWQFPESTSQGHQSSQTSGI